MRTFGSDPVTYDAAKPKINRTFNSCTESREPLVYIGIARPVLVEGLQAGLKVKETDVGVGCAGAEWSPGGNVR